MEIEEVFLVGAAILVLYGLGTSIRHTRETNEFLRRHDRRSEVWNRYIRASDLFAQWQIARPFLFVGQSAYAQSLLHTIIESYEWLMQDADWFGDEEVLEALKRLLEEIPPHFDPPTAAPHPRGFSFSSCHL